MLSWRLSNSMDLHFCLAALEEALSRYGKPEIFNTDQDSQFTSEQFKSMLLGAGVKISKVGKWRCLDNVFVERLWRSVKHEEMYLLAYENRQEARHCLGKYFRYYNSQRHHQRLGHWRPDEVYYAPTITRQFGRFLEETKINKIKLCFVLAVAATLTFANISPVYAAWQTSESIDEMSGKKSAYAFSGRNRPFRAMNFPYGNVRAWLGVGCDAGNEWAYVGFSTSPNLHDETKDGYSLLRPRIKWDDKLETTTMTQNWGSDFLHFQDKTYAIKMIVASNKMALELPWHGQGKVIFKFTLVGSSAAIGDIRKKCATF